MKVNIAIDRGNSSDKIYVIDENGNIVEQKRTTDAEWALSGMFEKYDVQNAIMSSVHKTDITLVAFMMRRKVPFLELTHTTPLPMQIAYATPETLGRDRIVAAVEAHSRANGKAAVVVDAGTAITLDVVTPDGKYLGGRIAPGVALRLKSLELATARLPEVSVEGDTPMVGYDTLTSIRSGVVRGAVAEIDTFIADLRSEYGEVATFITGGDANTLAPFIKSEVTVISDLLAFGLNRILVYNNENI